MGGLGLSWDILGGPGVVLANLGGSRGGLGRVLGQSWGGLEGGVGGLRSILWSNLVPSWGILGPLGGILGPLGDILVPFLLGWYYVTDLYWIL